VVHARDNTHPLRHTIRKRRAKLRSWWYGTPDTDKAMTFMGVGVVLVAVAVGAWFAFV
jgi:hypothetical protein